MKLIFLKEVLVDKIQGQNRLHEDRNVSVRKNRDQGFIKMSTKLGHLIARLAVHLALSGAAAAWVQALATLEAGETAPAFDQDSQVWSLEQRITCAMLCCRLSQALP